MDDIVRAGVAGALVVVALVAVIELLDYAHRWLRARGYEHEYARHVRQTVAARDGYASVGSMSLEDELAYYQELDAPVWASDLERAGVALPVWSAPEAARDTSHGAGSGSGPDLDAPPAPPLELPPGWVQPELPFDPDPDDKAQDEMWTRLLAAWSGDSQGDGVTHPSPQVRTGDDGEDNGTPKGRTFGLVAGVRYWVHPGRWWVAFAGCAPVDTSPPRPGWEPTRLGTVFDAVLAAEVASLLRDQDADRADYLNRLWEDK